MTITRFKSSIDFRHMALCAILSLSSAGLAFGETTSWTGGEGGRMRLVVLPANDDGERQAALQIEPAPGWITYWREPGDSGIPPQISPTAGSPFTFGALSFPVPKRLDLAGMRDLGYDGPVTLSFVVNGPKDAALLDATAFIGLCRNICIPFQVEFSLALSAGSAADAQEAAIVAEARSSLPKSPSADFSVNGFAMNADQSMLHLDLKLQSGAASDPRIIVTGPSGYLFTEYQAAKRKNGALSVDVPIAKLPRNYDIKGKRWGLLVISGGKAMETTLAFD
ncbi:MAG: protein-disulfide reductase DsbD domain-containing protein [Allorhizobium sp.]